MMSTNIVLDKNWSCDWISYKLKKKKILLDIYYMGTRITNFYNFSVNWNKN